MLFGLCFKTGNAVILKGGSDAIHSNIAIVSVIQKTLEQLGIPKEAASLIEDTSRDTAAAFIENEPVCRCADSHVGGAGLIRAVVNQATTPCDTKPEPETAIFLWMRPLILIWR